MITGIPKIDNGFNDIKESLIKSQKEAEEFKEKLMIELKNASQSEREFILFKTYFNGLHNDEISAIKIIKKYPSLINKLLSIIDEANSAKRCSSAAMYNRDDYFLEIMKTYKLLLEKMHQLAKELNIGNSLELSILFSYLLWNGYLSKNKKHQYIDYDDEPIILGMNFINVLNGYGVCRNYSEMLKDFLNYSGYQSVILANYMSNNIKVDYIMDIQKRRIQMPGNSKTFQIRKANHAFNLIEDKGMYIYDPTNLLLYNSKNQSVATLVNGKGKNKIFPYQSYDFCYSKEDEKMLDKLFAKEKVISPYDKTDFKSTSEITIDIMKGSHSLLEDFYDEAKIDIIGISEETKKALARLR